jgi:hypothetical protein
MKFLRDKIDISNILNLQAKQFIQPQYVEDIVPAGQMKSTQLNLSSAGAFLCLGITGSFTTLRIKSLGPTVLEDTGVCTLRMKFKGGAGTRDLFNDYVPMDLIFSPGRVRVDRTDAGLVTGGATLAAADLGPAPNQLFYPYKFEYLFKESDIITFQVQNDIPPAANGWQNRWRLCFYGFRVEELKSGSLRPVPATKK